MGPCQIWAQNSNICVWLLLCVATQNRSQRVVRCSRCALRNAPVTEFGGRCATHCISLCVAVRCEHTQRAPCVAQREQRTARWLPFWVFATYNSTQINLGSGPKFDMGPNVAWVLFTSAESARPARPALAARGRYLLALLSRALPRRRRRPPLERARRPTHGHSQNGRR